MRQLEKIFIKIIPFYVSKQRITVLIQDPLRSNPLKQFVCSISYECDWTCHIG